MVGDSATPDRGPVVKQLSPIDSCEDSGCTFSGRQLVVLFLESNGLHKELSECEIAS